MVPVHVPLRSAASMTPIVGLLHATNPIVYLSIGVGILAGIGLVVSIVKRRSTSKGGETMTDLAEDRASSRTQVASTSPIPPPEPLPLAAPPLAPPPLERTPPANPWSALDPAVELRAPGPGVLGRLRRRPLAEPQIRRPSLRAIGEEPRPTTRGSNGEKRSATSRAKSTSRSADGSAKKPPTPAPVPSGEIARRSGKPRAGKASAGKVATRTSAPGSGVREHPAADVQRRSRRTGSTPVKRTAPG